MLVSVGMATAAVPVILLSLLARRTRKLTLESEGQLSFKDDFHRSLARGYDIQACNPTSTNML